MKFSPVYDEENKRQFHLFSVIYLLFICGRLKEKLTNV